MSLGADVDAAQASLGDEPLESGVEASGLRQPGDEHGEEDRIGRQQTAHEVWLERLVDGVRRFGSDQLEMRHDHQGAKPFRA